MSDYGTYSGNESGRHHAAPHHCHRETACLIWFVLSIWSTWSHPTPRLNYSTLINGPDPDLLSIVNVRRKIGHFLAAKLHLVRNKRRLRVEPPLLGL